MSQITRYGAFVFKRGMWPLSVEKFHPAVDDTFGLEAVLQFVQVNSLLFGGSPEPFDEDFVEVSPLSVH